MCESVAGRWDLGRTSRLSAPPPAVQFCAQGLLSAALLCGCNTVAIASVYGGSRLSGSGFYVSCRGCRAVGIVGGQDPRQEPPSAQPKKRSHSLANCLECPYYFTNSFGVPKLFYKQFGVPKLFYKQFEETILRRKQFLPNCLRFRAKRLVTILRGQTV